MPVVHIRVIGLHAEVYAIIDKIAVLKSDVILENRPMFQHMQRYLGVELIEVTISKRHLSQATLGVLEQATGDYPKLLWEVTHKSQILFSNYTQYNTVEYPGPFGRLCQLYDKPYGGSVCNQCFVGLTYRELQAYDLTWQHSGDMYCSKHRDCPDDCRRVPCLQVVMLCPYCQKPLECTDRNEKGVDIYECPRDSRVFTVPAGATSLKAIMPQNAAHPERWTRESENVS